jgi:hypothetical protein
MTHTTTISDIWMTKVDIIIPIETLGCQLMKIAPKLVELVVTAMAVRITLSV